MRTVWISTLMAIMLSSCFPERGGWRTAIWDVEITGHFPEDAVRGRDYQIFYREDDTNSSIELKLRNLTDKTMYIGLGSWPLVNADSSPNAASLTGGLSFMQDLVFVHSENMRHPVKMKNLGYCMSSDDEPLACSIVIEPQGEILGSIAFSEFEGLEGVEDFRQIKLEYNIGVSFGDVDS